MSFTEQTTEVTYISDGLNTTFNIPFPWLEQAHVKVSTSKSDGSALVELVLGSEDGYEIDALGPCGADGANVQLRIAADAGYLVRIYRVVPLTQILDLINAGAFLPDALEQALDRIVMMLQQVNNGTIVVDQLVAGEANVGASVGASGVAVYAGKLGLALQIKRVRAKTTKIKVEDLGDNTVAIDLGTVAPADVGACAVGAATPAAVTAAAGTAGVSVAAAKDDHRHQVSTGTPIANTIGGAPAAGVANELARKDHDHGLVLYALTPAAVSVAGAVGTPTLAPLPGDHAHPHGAQTDGTLHAVATSSVNGFQSAADKAKVDSLADTLLEFFDDFTGGGDPDLYRWTKTLVGSGTVAPSSGEEWGCVTLTTGAVSADSVTLTSGLLASGQRVPKFACRIKVPDTTSVLCEVGLIDQESGSVYARFQLDRTVDANWHSEVKQAAEESVSSGITSGSFHELEFVVNADTSVQFYVDGVLVDTRSTAANIPSKTTPLRAYVKVKTQTALAKTCVVDFIRTRWSKAGRATTLVT